MDVPEDTTVEAAPAPAPAARRRPRLTLRTLMIVVAVVAADFSMMTVLIEPREAVAPEYVIVGLVMVLYDLLLYCTLLLLVKFSRPGPGGRPSAGLTAATVGVVAVFAGVPVATLVVMLLRA